MKLKHIIFTILIFIIVLLSGGNTVKADFLGAGETAFKLVGDVPTYDSTFKAKYSDGSFSNDWYESQNVFCLQASKRNPTKKFDADDCITIKLSNLPAGGITIGGSDQKIEPSQLHEIIYVYAQLKHQTSTRIYNWDSAEQHVIWGYLGQDNYRSHTKGAYCINTSYRGTYDVAREPCGICDEKLRYNKLQSEIIKIKAEASAYYGFVTNNKNLDNVKINLDQATLNGNTYGPIKIENYITSTVQGDDGKDYTYGGINNVTIDGKNVTISKYISKNEFYVNVGTNEIDINGKEIAVNLQGTANENSYLVFVNSETNTQNYVFGEAAIGTITKKAQINVTQIQFNIKKVDGNGNLLPDAEIGYQGPYKISSSGHLEEIIGSASNEGNSNNGWWIYNTTNQNPKEIKVLVNLNKFESNEEKKVYIKIQEQKFPENYAGYAGTFALEYKFNGEKWEYIRTIALEWDNDKSFHKLSDTTDFNGLIEFKGDTLTIKNKKLELSFDIKKVDEKGNLLPNATIGYQGPYKIESGFLKLIEGGTITADDTEAWNGWYTYETQQEPRKIKVSGIGSKYNIIYIKVQEQKFPEGYNGYDKTFVLEYKRTGTKWEYNGIYGTTWNDSQKLHTKSSKITSTEYLKFESDTLTIKNKLSDALNLNIKKVNKNTNAVIEAKFYIEVENGDLKDASGNSLNGKEISLGTLNNIKVIPESNSKEIKVTITETEAPAGYKELTEPIIIKWTYSSNKWSKKIVQGTGFGSLSGNTLTIKNEKDTGIGKINLKLNKVAEETGTTLSGANFSVQVENGVSNKSSCNSGATITITPNSKNKDVKITIKETEAPAGYIASTEDIIIVYEYNGSSWVLKNSNVDIDASGNVIIKNKKEVTIGKDKLQGTVYKDGYAGNKDALSPDGEFNGENGIEGVIVNLKDGSNIVSTDITDANGKYELNIPNRNHSYTVEFIYDGVNYEATTVGTSGQYIKESNRNGFNSRFETIEKGKSNDGTTLLYYGPGKTEYDVDYDGRSWILQTLTNNRTAKNEFKTTATTTFSLNNEVQYDCTWDERVYSHDEDDEGNDQCNCYWGDSGRDWYDYNQPSDTTSGGCDSGIDYTWQGTNWFIEAKVSGERYKTWRYENTNYYTKTNTNSFSTTQNDPCTLNFGLLKREVDLSLVNDLSVVDVEINGKKTTYKYDDILLSDDTLKIRNDSSNTIRESYELILTPNDFVYGTNNLSRGNGFIVDSEEGFKNESSYKENDELKITATYRIILNNQSSTTAKVNSIVYYYDTKYDNPKVFSDTDNDNNETIIIDGESYNKYDNVIYHDESVTIDGKAYNKIEIQGLGDTINLGSGGQYKKLFITFEMIREDVIKQGTYNTIAEITSYTIPNETVTVGTNQGKVDIDSAPGNAVQKEKLVYEDDTDIAPGLILGESKQARTISGFVWHDERDVYVDLENNEKDYEHGDGEYDNERLYNNIIVQLIEVKDGEYYLWNKDITVGGRYAFDNVIPGDYIVRFIYTRMNTEGTDIKSTIDKYYNMEWYNTNHIETTNGKLSVARDNEARRLDLIAETVKIDRELGENLKNGTNNKYMFADTSRINIAVAFDDASEATSIGDTAEAVDGRTGSYYNFNNVNFGLEERPKTAIELKKHVTGLRVTANDGTTIVDAELFENVGDKVNFTPNSIIKGLKAFYATTKNRNKWNLEADIEEAIAGSTLEIKYTYTVRNIGEIDYISTFLAQEYENKTEIDPVTNENKISEYMSLLQNSADVVRTRLLSNGGYNDIIGTFLGSTYYTGIPTENVSIVKTYVGKIEDYINNDLKFNPVQSSDFNINEEESGKDHDVVYVEKLRNGMGINKTGTNKINTVVISKYDIGNLAPGELRNQTIVLESNGKLTSTGVRKFPSNIAQIKTEYLNSAGRRDVYSIPGNLFYKSIPESFIISDAYIINDRKDLEDRWVNRDFGANIEPDSFYAETVEITKPTGENKTKNVALIISITAGIALVGIGTFAIKKYVL